MEGGDLFICQLGVRSGSLAARADVGRQASIERPVVAFVEVEGVTGALSALSTVQTAQRMHGCAFLGCYIFKFWAPKGKKKGVSTCFSFGFLWYFWGAFSKRPSVLAAFRLKPYRSSPCSSVLLRKLQRYLLAANAERL